ncbi:MAG TPA: DUF72 domain-containing protein [Candidatus Nanopelagicales bacterium]|nr:DUF72 domain-containing protein [Candidatus Nanopelagicales bacterium]
MAGVLRTGTSGFAYPAWAPAFYPAGVRGDALLPAYAARLGAVELNGTYYRQVTPEQAASWAARVPPSFRFAVKLLRTGSLRAYATDPAGTLPWLTAPLAAFGRCLGTALFRIGAGQVRDDGRLDRLLAAWPAGVPLALEAQDPSWQVDETHERLRIAAAVLVVTETDDAPDPPLTVTGPFLYLRLRRTLYGTADLDSWAARLEPFLADGRDAFVFFRHDEQGATPGYAAALAARLPQHAPAGAAGEGGNG